MAEAEEVKEEVFVYNDYSVKSESKENLNGVTIPVNFFRDIAFVVGVEGDVVPRYLYLYNVV